MRKENTPGRREELIRLYRRLSHRITPLPAGREATTRGLHGIRAILFDVYGTLLVSASGDIDAASAMDPADALQKALASCGLAPAADAGAIGAELLELEIRRRHALLRAGGCDFPEIDILSVWDAALRELFKMGRIAAPADAWSLPGLAIERECRVNPVWPMPGAAETLGILRRHGLRIGIVSNAQFFTPIAIEALFGTDVVDLGFEPALTAWSYEIGEAKPGLTPFLKPLDRLQAEGFRPDQIAFIGNDCLNDLVPAQKLGMQPILFAGDRRSLRLRESDEHCAPVRQNATVITGLSQLPELLV